MARNSDLITQRNNSIRERYKYYRKKNPKWTLHFVIAAVADEFYLSVTTIQRIVFQKKS